MSRAAVSISRRAFIPTPCLLTVSCPEGFQNLRASKIMLFLGSEILTSESFRGSNPFLVFMPKI